MQEIRRRHSGSLTGGNRCACAMSVVCVCGGNGARAKRYRHAWALELEALGFTAFNQHH